MPRCVQGIEHMNKVVEANILAPIADEVATKAEVVLIGYPAAVSQHIRQQALRNLADIKGLKSARAGRADSGRRRSRRRHVSDGHCL